MRIRALNRRRVALAAAGLLAAGALSGCRNGGAPFAYNGVARGDIGAIPTSPAFAQVAAGQRMGADGKGTITFVAAAPMPGGQPEMMSPGTPLMLTQMNGQPVLGSGGMVYPVGYTQAGQMVMTGPAMNVQPAPQVPAQPYTVMTVPGGQGVPAQGTPSMAMSMPAHQPVMMSMPANVPTAGTPGQPMVMLVQGPNGPQYMIVEMAGSPAPTAVQPMPTTVSPAPMAPATPAVTPAAAATPTATPFAAAAPLPAPTNTTAPAMPEPAPTPSFSPPPPANVSLPALPAPPAPADTGMRLPDKAPDPLPPGVSAKPPTGPLLPTSHAAPRNLGSFPAAPAKDPGPGVKLPPATGAVEGDIPSAPVFLPATR